MNRVFIVTEVRRRDGACEFQDDYRRQTDHRDLTSSDNGGHRCPIATPERELGRRRLMHREEQPFAREDVETPFSTLPKNTGFWVNAVKTFLKHSNS